MNLRMDLDVIDTQEKTLDIAKPKGTYQSPLQKIGEALRLPQSLSATAATKSPSKQQSDEHPPNESNSPTRDFINYSYKVLSPVATPTKLPQIDEDTVADATQDDSSDTGSILGHTTEKHNSSSSTRGSFSGTSLLSSLFSNPRTRAPFKPQKSNRGTSSWQLKQYAEATLGSGSLRKAVKLPEGEDKDEWLAVNGELVT